jgi:hypothetical protein
VYYAGIDAGLRRRDTKGREKMERVGEDPGFRLEIFPHF